MRKQPVEEVQSSETFFEDGGDLALVQLSLDYHVCKVTTLKIVHDHP